MQHRIPTRSAFSCVALYMFVYIYMSVYVGGGCDCSFELTTSSIKLKMSGILLNCL